MTIKQLRKSKLLTQDDVATKLDIQKGYYGMIERGEYMPSGKIIKKLARAFKMPAEMIYKILQENLKTKKGV